MTEFSFKNVPDGIADVVVGLDVDGTLSSTQRHMKGWETEDGQHIAGFNDRLMQAFPVLEPHMDDLVAARIAFRNEFGHLPHTEQSQVWGQRHDGYNFDSQFGFYFGELPDVFTPEMRVQIREWSRNPNNFGYGEYDDVPLLIKGLHALGKPAILHTMGHDITVEGGVSMPGWQRLKVESSPTLCQFPQHITAQLPQDGKGEQYTNWYDRHSNTFIIPRTDKPGEFIEARKAVLLDDSEHNIRHMPENALGILVDRNNQHANTTLPDRVHRVRSVAEAPEVIANFATQ